MTKRTTIHDIAQALGITASSVSRALNNHPGISSVTKELVQKKAKEMNYKVNTMASNLRKGHSKTIGLIVPRINRYFFADVIAGIESITTPAGYNLVICQSAESPEKEKENVQTFIRSRVDGVIISITSHKIPGKHLEMLLSNGIPLVQFDRVKEELSSSMVLNDNFSGTYQATKHLIEQGFLKIAHITSDLKTNIYQQRLLGYKAAIEEAGMIFQENCVKEIDLSREAAYELAKTMHANNWPDAFCCSSDFIAHGIMLYCKENNIRIPEDVGITGFANEPFTKYIDPPLTTLEQFGMEMGKESAKILLGIIESNATTTIPKTLIIKPELKIRASSTRIFTTNNTEI